MKGLFISFEGVDGCGKSTQLRFLGEYLKEKGHDLLFTREPGGCVIAEKIRGLLLDVENAEMDAKTEALLYAAARAQHVAQVIGPALMAGKIVLCDRFIDSSLAYQGVGRRLGIGNIFDINCFATGGIMPDKTFFLDYPPDLAFSRMSKRREHDRLEKEEMAFHQTLYKGFIELSGLYPDRVIRVDAQGTKYETSDKIRAMMDQILLERKKQNA
jgi:dTMP kinase